MSPAPWSVRARLLAILLAGLALVWGAATVATVLEADHELQEVFDARLAQVASVLALRLGDEEEAVDLEHAPVLHRYAKPLSFQVWKHGTRLMLHSADAPDEPFSATTQGFSTVRLNGREWRVFSLRGADGEHTVQVREAARDRRHLLMDIGAAVARPLLFALPLFALLVWVAVGRSLRPLARVGDEIARRDPSRLAPIEGPVPAEIASLVGRLNALFARLSSAMEGERRFTADAAHELRTPLAALRAQLQVAQGATDGGERDRAIARALAAGERATHVVEQLLVLARLEHDAWREAAAAFDLHRVAADALAERAAQAHARRIELSLEGEPATMAAGHAGLAAIALGNLVDNAIRYSPPDTAVTIALSREPGRAVAAVRDQGPGIAPGRREEALRRFARLGDGEADGSGLGLSIVARIAELHGADLRLEDGPGGRGLAASLAFPAA